MKALIQTVSARTSLLGVLLLGAALPACAPGYMRASELERRDQGPTACSKSCQDLGMRMVAMVLVSNDIPGCVCQVLETQNANPPSAATPAPVPAAPPAVAPVAPVPAPAAPPAPVTPPPGPTPSAPGVAPSAPPPPGTPPVSQGVPPVASPSSGGYVVIAAVAAARKRQEQVAQQQHK